MSQTPKNQTSKPSPGNGAKSDVDMKNSVARGPTLRGPVTAPELPKSMYNMLHDVKGDDRELKCITVRFFKSGTQEVQFSTTDDEGAEKVMTPSQYELYKEAEKRKRSKESAKQAAQGLLKKFAHRCYIFPALDGDGEGKKLLSIQPPKLVVGMMKLSQVEFNSKYPDPDEILKFWYNQNSEVIEVMESYGKSVGQDSWSNTISDLWQAYEARMKKRADKQAKKVAGGGSSKVPNPPATTVGTGGTRNGTKDPDPKEKSGTSSKPVTDWKDDEPEEEEINGGHESSSPPSGNSGGDGKVATIIAPNPPPPIVKQPAAPTSILKDTSPAAGSVKSKPGGKT